MKKILVSMFLLVFGLCLVGCREPIELIKPIEHNCEYIDGLCDCGEFDISWLNENFRLSDEQILFKGSVDDEFNCDVILLTLKHTTTYIELSKRHFKIDEITKVSYISSTPPSHFFEPGNENKLDNFNQIVFLYVDVESKEETKVGYVVKANDNSIIELGTCKVTVVDYDNRDVYVLCYDIEENSLGEMVITISDGVSTVTSLNGEIESIIELNTTAEIVE